MVGRLRRHPSGDGHSQHGWVSLAGRRMEKVRLSGWEALADVRRELNTRCVGRVSLAREGLEKVRLSGREYSRRRPSGDRYSLCRTGEEGKVKLCGPGGSHRHLTGDGYSQPG